MAPGTFTITPAAEVSAIAPVRRALQRALLQRGCLVSVTDEGGDPYISHGNAGRPASHGVKGQGW